jgi:hypothetical protein
MPRTRRNDDWGFPRWRAYGGGAAAQTVRICDRQGCDQPGDCPAPKAPNRPERWWFCAAHAAEYNRGWDYFAGLTPEEAARRAEEDARETSFASAGHWQWGGPGDGSRSRAEMDALAVLGCDPDADMATIKAAWRQASKESHPDVAGKDGADRFRAVQAAFKVLSDSDAAREAAQR